MKYERAQMVQRPFSFAIVDEVDSILIDEARTPLIISGPTDDKSELYMSGRQAGEAACRRGLRQGRKAEVDHPDRRRHRKDRTAARDCRPARRRQPLRFRKHPGRASHQPGAARECHVQARHRLYRQGRQGRHHRRIYRPHDGRAPLVRRPASGGRSQGRRRDRAGKPDARLDHFPELFPHVSEDSAA